MWLQDWEGQFGVIGSEGGRLWNGVTGDRDDWLEEDATGEREGVMEC